MTSKLNDALIKAQAGMKNVARTATNPHFRNKYTPLDDLLVMARPVLNSNGLSITQAVHDNDGDPVLVTTLHHVSGEVLEAGRMPLLLDKQTMQGLGSAVTYARRYSLAGILGITTDDDDDAAGASTPPAATNAATPLHNRILVLIDKTGTDLSKVLEYAKVVQVADMDVKTAQRVVAFLEKREKDGPRKELEAAGITFDTFRNHISSIHPDPTSLASYDDVPSDVWTKLTGNKRKLLNQILATAK